MKKLSLQEITINWYKIGQSILTGLLRIGKIIGLWTRSNQVDLLNNFTIKIVLQLLLLAIIVWCYDSTLPSINSIRRKTQKNHSDLDLILWPHLEVWIIKVILITYTIIYLKRMNSISLAIISLVCALPINNCLEHSNSYKNIKLLPMKSNINNFPFKFMNLSQKQDNNTVKPKGSVKINISHSWLQETLRKRLNSLLKVLLTD